nr:Ig-like domain-containing protein [Lachnospiraceae bacterium]
AVSITAKAEERVDGEPKQDTIVISTYIPVSAVKADVKELTVSEGSTGWIKLRSISPSNATDKSFTWKSSNPKVLEIKDPRQDTVYFAETVIDHGEVMAVEYHAILGGTATLTGTANDGSGKKIVIKVKVLGKIHNGDTKIKVKNLPKKATVENNESDTVTVDNLKIKDKFTIDPILTSTASDKRVTFRSTNPGVATVDSKGKVVIKNKGTAVISMSTADGGYQASVTVKVP